MVNSTSIFIVVPQYSFNVKVSNLVVVNLKVEVEGSGSVQNQATKNEAGSSARTRGSRCLLFLKASKTTTREAD